MHGFHDMRVLARCTPRLRVHFVSLRSSSCGVFTTSSGAVPMSDQDLPAHQPVFAPGQGGTSLAPLSLHDADEDRALLRQELRRRDDDEGFLLEAHQVCDNSADSEQYLLDIAVLVAGRYGDVCSLYLRREGRDYLDEVASWCRDPLRRATLSEQLKRFPVLFGKGARGGVAASGKGVLLTDPQHDHRADPTSTSVLYVGSTVIVPLKVGQRVLGILVCTNLVGTAPHTHRDLTVLQRLADRVALQVEHDRLTADVLREQEERKRDSGQLDAVIDNALFGLVMLSDDGALLRINPAARTLLDLPMNERSPFLPAYEAAEPRLRSGDLLPPEQSPLTGPFPGRVVGSLDFSIVVGGRGRRDFGLTGVPVRNADGVVQCMLYVFQDVSNRLQLERQKNEFLSIASHELKTPLTSLKGYMQSLVRRMQRNPASVTEAELKDKFRRMVGQVDRLAELIDDMLDVSRAQSGKLALRLERVDLRELLQEVVERTFPVLADVQPTHTLTLSLPDAPVEGIWDRSRIDQVLTNLLTNAAKYSSAGTTISVTVEQRGKTAVMTVADQGIGIPADDQARLFQPFFRARNASLNDYSGIGLGLYLTRELVLRHNGSLSFESREGEGSTFRVELPCDAALPPIGSVRHPSARG